MPKQFAGPWTISYTALYFENAILVRFSNLEKL